MVTFCITIAQYHKQEINIDKSSSIFRFHQFCMYLIVYKGVYAF